MEQRYLLDSNVIIGFLAGKIPSSNLKFLSEIVDKTVNISVISQIEVLRFNDTPENETILKDFINISVIYPLSTEIIQRTIEICKKNKMKLPDAIIAATALVEDFILVTRNVNDFKIIPNLTLLNPWDIS